MIFFFNYVIDVVDFIMEQLFCHENKDWSRHYNEAAGKTRSLADDECLEKCKTAFHSRISVGSSAGQHDRNVMLVKTGKRSSFSSSDSNEMDDLFLVESKHCEVLDNYHPGLNMKEVKGVGLKPSLKVIILLLHCHIEKCLDQESSRPSKCYESKAGTL
uniref:Uncharacterized protein n=1 Tax=Guillardia theta TaxID=55529 RepID=A0A7S4HAT2_GUITH|mmetsp:Transcript_12433/g.43270  ORF Transcript_12433/g.43270 Transcript_12433/m.43270 type:complete len:159 (+) Transcript_12433:270-746(+)